MQIGDFLFVYGTLRRGEGASLERNLQVHYVGSDEINGKIYNIGWFPGLVDTSELFDRDLPVVVGDLFVIKTKAISSILDAYEGYPHLYGRSKVDTAHGRQAWVYTYNGDVSGKIFIPSGDWTRRDEVPVKSPLDELTKLAMTLDNTKGTEHE